MKLKIMSVVLILVMVILQLAACKAPDEPESESTDLLPEKVLISASGSTEFKIITGSNIPAVFREKFGIFADKLEETSGTRFKSSDDFLRSDIDPDALLEIIFASANRKESINIYRSINFDGYAVKYEGNKIVIAAYTPEAIQLAIDGFFEKCIEVVTDDSGNKSVYLVKELVYKGEDDLLFGEDISIADYKVIYSREAEGAAKKFVNAVEKYSGIKLTASRDIDTPVSEHEIIIGETRRTETRELQSVSAIEIGIKVVGKKLVIRSGSPYNIEDDIQTIIDTYLPVSAFPNFPINLEAAFCPYAGTDRISLTEGADLRIMSFNILTEGWADNSEMEPRVTGVIGCIAEYLPDVIGIQEVSPAWYKHLRDFLGDEYEFINSDILGSKNYNYTALAYRKATVELIETDLHFYSQGNLQRIRLLNTGVFKLKSNGKQFIVTNTHYNANHTSAEFDTEVRYVQATEFLEKVKGYAAKYNCPIISTGDYNSTEGSKPYNKTTEDDFMLSSKYTAKKVNKVLACHNVGVWPGDASSTIDHIFYHGDITALYFTTLMDKYLVKASDHCPIYTDFAFK